jgi:mono/diheme cytochrome c family protein
VSARLTKILTAAAGLLALIAISGCDLQEEADLENGEQLFSEQCGRCHILAASGSVGEVGPDLDAAFAEVRANPGFDEDSIEGVVEYQIRNPRYTDPEDPTYMPANLVTGDDASDVAAYVASVAGVPGIEPPEVPGGPGGQVFADNGCGNCHVLSAAESNGQVGPNLDDVLPGQSAAMIEESIVDPEAQISSGFSGGVMPGNYGETISPEDLQLLVEFLQESATGGNAGGGGGNAGGGGGNG